MTAISNYLHSTDRPQPTCSKLSPLVKEIARRSFKELAVSLALTALCLPFVATINAALSLLATTVALVALNALIQCTTRLYLGNNEADLTMRSTIFALSSGVNATTLVHEAGHAALAKLCFRGTPSITILPFAGGFTTYESGQLTRLGHSLGFRRSIFLIVLAGPALALLAATVAFAYGLSKKKTDLEFSEYLAASSAHCFLNHAYYAYTALFTTPADTGHDFGRLKTFGIHPLAATAAILAIPLFISMALWEQEPATDQKPFH